MEKRHIRTGILILVAIDLLLVTGHVIYNALGKWPNEVMVLVDLDAESAIPAWWSSIQLFMLAQLWLVATWFAWRRTASGERRTRWMVRWATPALALMFLALSGDEAASIHERLGHHVDVAVIGSDTRETTVFSTTGFWAVVLGPIALALLLPPLIQVGRAAGWRCMGMLLAGVGVYIGSAAGTEIFSNFTGGRDGFWPTVQVTAEEGGEMLGVVLLIWGAAGVALALSKPAVATATAVKSSPAPRRVEPPVIESATRRTARPSPEEVAVQTFAHPA